MRLVSLIAADAWLAACVKARANKIDSLSDREFDAAKPEGRAPLTHALVSMLLSVRARASSARDDALSLRVLLTLHCEQREMKSLPPRTLCVLLDASSVGVPSSLVSYARDVAQDGVEVRACVRVRELRCVRAMCAA